MLHMLTAFWHLIILARHGHPGGVIDSLIQELNRFPALEIIPILPSYPTRHTELLCYSRGAVPLATQIGELFKYITKLYIGLFTLSIAIGVVKGLRTRALSDVKLLQLLIDVNNL